MQGKKPPVGLSFRLPVSLIAISNTRSIETRPRARHPMQLPLLSNPRAKVRRCDSISHLLGVGGVIVFAWRVLGFGRIITNFSIFRRLGNFYFYY